MNKVLDLGKNYYLALIFGYIVQKLIAIFSFGFVQVLKPLKVDVVEEDEILVLNFGDTLPIGLGLLTIHFQGSLNKKMKGFYIRYIVLLQKVFFFFWGGGGGIKKGNFF